MVGDYVCRTDRYFSDPVGMMRGVVILFLIFFSSFTARSQTVQWASTVVGFSSEGKGEPYTQQYKASQILGKPNRLPGTGDNPCAWSPLYPDGANDEWITVRFPQAIPVRQIAIFQSGHPGAVTNVLVVDASGKETSVFNGLAAQNPSGESTNSSLLHILPANNTLVANTVKIVLSPNRIKGPNGIDAVGISADAQPIAVKVNVSPDAPKDINKENLGKQIN